MSGYTVVNILGALLIITSAMVVLAKSPKNAAYLYAAQSGVVVAMFVTLAVTTGSGELYLWSVSAFFTKVVFVPLVMLYTIKKMGPMGAVPSSTLSPTKILFLIAIELFICFVVINPIDLPTAVAVKPALAISLAHFFIGLTCIVSSRNILKQVLGYCLMENGSHITLALLAPQAPELIEVGVATDAIFAVIILCVIVLRIHRVNGTLDANDLTNLKG